MLRPGGFFVWSATPIYQKLRDDVQIWNGIAFINITPDMFSFSCLRNSNLWKLWNVICSHEGTYKSIVLGSCVDYQG